MYRQKPIRLSANSCQLTAIKWFILYIGFANYWDIIKINGNFFLLSPSNIYMKTLEDLDKKPEKGSKKAFWIAAAVAALAIAGIVAVILTRPTTEEYQQQTIEGAFREGSPEFAALTKKIAVENDTERTTESPVAMGTIQMSIWGRVRNLTGKTITGLELKVSVVDLAEKTIKEKTEIIIPKKQASIEPFQVMPVNVIMDGFHKEDNRANIHWKVTAIKTNY